MEKQQKHHSTFYKLYRKEDPNHYYIVGDTFFMPYEFENVDVNELDFEEADFNEVMKDFKKYYKMF